MSAPRFIISLDFELHWGVFDHMLLNTRSRRYFDLTRELIPRQLTLFEKNGIRATWATVGILFAKDKAQLEAFLPTSQPGYYNTRLNPYPLIMSKQVGNGEAADPYHYAPSLIEKILSTPGQEVGSHTFSHYYCLEEGQSETDFNSDLKMAQALAYENFGIRLQALVFPRNQYKASYLRVVKENSFTSVRTNPNSWFWQIQANDDESIGKRFTRLLDHYLKIELDTSFAIADNDPELSALPASRFFRPYIAKLDAYGGQQLKVKRICSEMTRAAQMGRCYQLWWHPHNMATHPIKNFKALEHIITCYHNLHRQYGMETAHMSDMIKQPKSTD